MDAPLTAFRLLRPGRFGHTAGMARVCDVDGCGKKHNSRGLCKSHLHAWRMANDSEYASRKRAGASAWKKANPEKVRQGERRREQRAENREKRRQYREQNAEACRAATARWTAENREYVREFRKQRYIENKEHELAVNREWRLANLERFRQLIRRGQARRRALGLAVDESGITEAMASGLRERSCAKCGAPGPSTVDHILPLSWAHVAEVAECLGKSWCYQPLCGPCNSSKRDFRVESYVPTGDIG